MHRQSYSYSYATTPAPKYSSSHGTSSAFSASANPNEDWTKISDLAERRRIQNRIAQRNYRKKLKRRLEDLERRAASASASPPQTHEEIAKPRQNSEDSQSSNPSMTHGDSSDMESVHRHISPDLISSHYIASTYHNRNNMYSHDYSRSSSPSPPPSVYSMYPPPDQIVYPPYPQHTAHHTLPIGSSDGMPMHSHYLPPIPTTLPGMSEYAISMKHDGTFSEDDTMNPYSMSYAAITGMEIPSSQSYQESNLHTPPLSHSFEDSPLGSPSGLSGTFPTTPVSVPSTPPPRQRVL